MKRLRRMKQLTHTAIFLVLSAMVFPFTIPAVMAQATTGGLRGVVTDNNAAIIAGADVTATNTATGVESKSRTNSQGVYAFPRLLPGKYLLVIETQ
ncbi:MAG: carboxypeptidase-like regulatory domain-containing protein, partial [Blastocatellia bacterium]|nr:carboxypeptidase-like regulatory domain-containing protein [Blastocatellia bacterium]